MIIDNNFTSKFQTTRDSKLITIDFSPDCKQLRSTDHLYTIPDMFPHGKKSNKHLRSFNCE